jgi:hypothetical protein
MSVAGLAPAPFSTRPVTRRGRIGWWAFGGAIVLLAVVGLLSMQTGLHGDLRTINPNPGPAPYPPVLGVENWPLVTSATSVVLTLGLLATCTWLSLRQRRLHWSAVLALATLFTGFLDPLANWATFTVFDPRVAHFPPSWPWVGIAPLTEPSLSFLGGYASYYFLTGLALYWMHERFVRPRAQAESWAGRHALLTLFLFAAAVSVPINAIIQLQWLYVGLFVYTEAAGPIIHVGHVQLPLFMALYDAFLYATIALLCRHDPNGQSVVLVALARRLPSGRTRSEVTSVRLVLIATALLFVAYLVPIGVMSALRVGGLANPSYDRWPFPTVKIIS